MSFTHISTRTIPEINSICKVFTHDQTGAQILSIVNDDENKCFGITFRTPPADSTGIAHIMEHSVLCGSRKYPVKEPFVEIIKSSLQTFVNAFTFSDKTCYPCASQNLKDFYNLIDIYLDATLYPLIPEHTFRQEGWHYEIESPDAPLTFKGVVFNEMKGAYSSPDDLLDSKARQSLFPNHLYGLESGGDPQAMPDLTYSQFKAFHETYYHPSNAYIYFYGDDPEAERLNIIESWLKDFEKKETHSQIPLQPKFPAPQKLTYPYDSGDTSNPKAYLSINWLLPEVEDIQTSLEFSLLSHILLSTPASPLKKILIESGLGENITGGFDEHLRQPMFSAGLKGVQPENLGKVEALIMDSLQKLSREGIDPQTIAASVNTTEFLLREQNTGRFPRGLSLMLAALTTWLYDKNPLDALAFESPFALLKEKIKSGNYFESLIEKHLLNNPHRTTVSLMPDPEEGKRREAVETERLANAKAGMSIEELNQVIAQAEELRLIQDTPDSAENLAKIPSLLLTDIDPAIKLVPSQKLGSEQAPILFHDLPTNGIVYLDLGFDLHSLPQHYLPYVGLLGRLFLEMGTEREDFVRLSQRIGTETGGIRSATLSSAIKNSNRPATWFFLRGKATAPQTGPMLAILKDILANARFDQPERFKQIVLERKAGLESGLIPGGSGVVNQRLRARFNPADWLSEQTHGISHLFFLRNLVETIEKDWPSVLADLQKVREVLLHQSAIITNITAEKQHFDVILPELLGFLSGFPARQPTEVEWNYTPPAHNEGLTIPAQVNYVGKGTNLYKLGYQLHGSVQVINNYLQTTWLWDKVRVQGGAYGGHSGFDIHSGVFTYLSYRDPNLTASLDIYDATAEYLRNLQISDEELNKAIIGTIGDLDSYMLPDAKGWISMSRFLLQYDDEFRQKFRNEVLHTTAKDFNNFGDILHEAARAGEIVVLGSADAIEKANQERQGLLEVIKVL